MLFCLCVCFSPFWHFSKIAGVSLTHDFSPGTFWLMGYFNSLHPMEDNCFTPDSRVSSHELRKAFSLYHLRILQMGNVRRCCHLMPIRFGMDQRDTMTQWLWVQVQFFLASSQTIRGKVWQQPGFSPPSTRFLPQLFTADVIRMTKHGSKAFFHSLYRDGFLAHLLET